MKLLKSIALLIFSSLSALGSSYTYSSSWDINVNQTIIGSTKSGFGSYGTSTLVSLPYYDASLHNNETLIGVNISYVSPIIGVPSTVQASVSSTGASTFSSETMTISTSIYSDSLSAAFADHEIENSAFDYGSYTKNVSGSRSKFTLGANQSYMIILNKSFNKTQFVSNTAADSYVFNGTGDYTFNVFTNESANYSRSAGASDLTFSYIGRDTGYITVTYFTVPEVNTCMALIPITLFVICVRKRK